MYLVCESLLKNTPKHLNEKQLAKRLQLIEVLHDYAEQKIFPTNLYHSTRTPYFVDDFGVHCAVGYLMAESGYTDLVATIRANENYAYIAEIKTPGVVEWAGEHGFDVEELKWIQPGYGVSAHYVAQIGNGTNGNVKHLVSNNSQGLVISGSFDSLDLQPCLNIGVFKDNQLSCLGTGIDGIINDVAVNFGKVMVFGLLYHEGESYTMATFEQGQWEYENIPTREGSLAYSGFFYGLSYSEFEVVIDHPTENNVQEIWARSGSSNWFKQATVNGVVNKIGNYFSDISLTRVFVGHFNEAIILDYVGDTIYTVETNNVLFRDNLYNWVGVEGNAVSDTVKTFIDAGGQLYFGGSASLHDNSSGVVLSRYMNNVMQPVLTTNSFYFTDSTVSINAVGFHPSNSSLCIGGDFMYSPPMGGFTKNLAYYNPHTNSIIPLAVLDRPVNTFAWYYAAFNFGGEFTTNLTNNPINHLGKIGPHLSLEEHSFDNSIQVFPNPTSDIIHVTPVNNLSPYRILDLNGRVVHQGTIHGESTIDLSDLSSGVYMLHVMSDSGNVVRRIVKQ